ncbi:MAG: hypothetical protein APF82_02645 [Sphingomonadales bacterium BRH_c42]|nr:MAG: hypothetical protein APF82_02645 [Sphingomonadales bacterium BRH_c42]
MSLAALGCMFASPVRAADDPAPVVLEPSSQWVVDFAEDKCRLLRTFGEEGNRHLLSFEQHGPSAWFGFIVAGPKIEEFRPSRTEIQFGDYPPIEYRGGYTGINDEYGAALIYSLLKFPRSKGQDKVAPARLHSLPEIDPAQASKIAAITIRQGKRKVVFNTGKLTEAIKVLNQCSQDLLNSWGLDLERHRTAMRLPIWTNDAVIWERVRRRYPDRAARIGEQAVFRLRAIVDEAGLVAECTMLEATIVQKLESPACESMRNARFEPALDLQGRPMRSFYLTTISYRIN